jgi:hypothetical protein
MTRLGEPFAVTPKDDWQYAFVSLKLKEFGGITA